jgi:hypothetical protein
MPDIMLSYPKSKKGKKKVATVMKEWKAGGLKSGSGQPVKSKEQAVAIALSEGRKKEKR